jgi:hypothetical protein
MADIKYDPKFQPPTWRDSVDLVLAEGPNGFNAQFQNLRDELDALSAVVKTLSDTINSLSKNVDAANTAANAAKSAVQIIRWGIIDPKGKKISGSGNFTATRIQQGLYEIVFNPVFTASPAVQVTYITQWNDPNITAGTGSTTLALTGISSSKFRVGFSVPGNPVYQDSFFAFIVYGS